MASVSLAVAATPATTATVGKAVPVFVAGQGGYAMYRIPAIVRTPDGTLLAFAEGRPSIADYGHNQIVLKRSSDGGKTWSKARVAASFGKFQASNAAPVVDTLDPRFPKGRVFLFYDTGNASEAQLRQGHGQRKVWYRTSIDDGRRWSVPVDITAAVKKPDWRTYANTPGHAMQFKHGKYKGRIFVAANHSKGPPQPYLRDYHAHGFFTDDHGRTFALGATLPLASSNESTAAELAGDRLMMNSRNQAGHHRIVAISDDGGAHWADIYIDPQLPDPISEGSLLNVGYRDGKAVLAFCNNDDTQKRTHLVVHLSFDGGTHWTRKIHVSPPGAQTGYCDIVAMGKQRIGVLYERDGYKQIAFKVIHFTP
ncbi:MAG TPA: sialidase family protein [Rhodanobacteraceae bacterium]